MHGRSLFPGRALGTARLVRSFADLVVAFPRPVARPFWLGEEPEDVGRDVVCILLGRHGIAPQDFPSDVVAVVSETSWEEASGATCALQKPCVDDVGARLRMIHDGDLVLVDGDAGVVVVDPTDRIVAAFQAHALGIMPPRRVFLEYAHQPVRLPDGREVRVSASVRDISLISQAVEEGPDALYVWAECEPDAIPAAMVAAHGKPTAFAIHPEGCCEAAIARASVLGDVTAMVTTVSSPECLAAFRQAVREASWKLVEDGIDVGHVRYGLVLQEAASDPAMVLVEGVERVAACMSAPEPGGEWLQALLDTARSVVVPVEIVVGEGCARFAERVLDLGVNGVITPAHEVQVWKESLRTVFAVA